MSPGRLGRWAMLALLLSAALGSANLWVCDAEELPSASTASATPDRAVAADASV